MDDNRFNIETIISQILKQKNIKETAFQYLSKHFYYIGELNDHKISIQSKDGSFNIKGKITRIFLINNSKVTMDIVVTNNLVYKVELNLKSNFIDKIKI